MFTYDYMFTGIPSRYRGVELCPFCDSDAHSGDCPPGDYTEPCDACRSGRPDICFCEDF